MRRWTRKKKKQVYFKNPSQTRWVFKIVLSKPISRILSRAIIYLGLTLLSGSGELLFLSRCFKKFQSKRDSLLLHRAGFTASLRYRKTKGVLLPYFSSLPRPNLLCRIVAGGLVSVALSLSLALGVFISRTKIPRVTLGGRYPLPFKWCSDFPPHNFTGRLPSLLRTITIINYSLFLSRLAC